MEIVASNWKKVATAIGFNEARIKAVEHCKPEDATFEIFSRWLKGEYNLKPVTWDSLAQCLKDANFQDIADMLCNIQIVSVAVMFWYSHPHSIFNVILVFISLRIRM